MLYPYSSIFDYIKALKVPTGFGPFIFCPACCMFLMDHRKMSLGWFGIFNSFFLYAEMKGSRRRSMNTMTIQCAEHQMISENFRPWILIKNIHFQLRKRESEEGSRADTMLKKKGALSHIFSSTYKLLSYALQTLWFVLLIFSLCTITLERKENSNNSLGRKEKRRKEKNIKPAIQKGLSATQRSAAGKDEVAQPNPFWDQHSTITGPL